MKPHFRMEPVHSFPLILISLAIMINSGCSVYMAAKQPDAKNLAVLNAGTHRSRVIAELGAPVWSGDKDGAKTDVFVFKHGYGAPARTGRALFHATADVFTLGLWEAVSTPTEAYFSGSDFKVEVAYDEKNQVISTQDLTGENPQLNYGPVPAEQKSKKNGASPPNQASPTEENAEGPETRANTQSGPAGVDTKETASKNKTEPL